MATSRARAQEQEQAPAQPLQGGYFVWSRDFAVGLFAVLPLWLIYELLRLSLTPQERNGAEALLLDTLGLLGPATPVILRVAFLITVVWAALSILRRELPWARVAMVSALEGTVYGLLLGPLAGALATSAYRILELGTSRSTETLVADLVGALGAGIFEELVFRLFLLSVLGLLMLRAVRAFGLPPVVGVVAAVLISALLFAWFHHLPPSREPFTVPAFLFRSMAGLILGTLFVWRGFGVCVYTHAMYDVHYYLTH